MGEGGGQHPRLKLMFGTGLALLLLALAPRYSLADVFLTKMNLRNAGGEEQPSKVLPFNMRHVDGLDMKDVNLNDGAVAAYGSAFNFHDESDGKNQKNVSLTDSD